MNRLIFISTLILLATSSFVCGQRSDYDSLYLFRNCVTLDAKESVDDDRDDLIYKWEFGDGEIGGGQVVEHCFDSLGTYKITLSIIDPSVVSLFQDEWNFEVVLKEDYSISFGLKQSGKLISCTSNLKYDEIPDKINYFWDFGNGNFEIGNEVSHTYDSAGHYSIRLLAEVAAGDEIIQLSTTQTIKIN